MSIRVGFLLIGIVLGVAVSVVTLVLSHSFLRAWLLAQPQDTTVSSLPPAAHEHGKPAAPSTPAPAITDLNPSMEQPTNTMVVSPERLQTIGVRFASGEALPLDSSSVVQG